MGDVLRTEVGIAQIVVEVGTGTLLEQLLIVLDGLMVVALQIFVVGIFLSDGSCTQRKQKHHQQQHRHRAPA